MTRMVLETAGDDWVWSQQFARIMPDSSVYFEEDGKHTMSYSGFTPEQIVQVFRNNGWRVCRK